MNRAPIAAPVALAWLLPFACADSREVLREDPPLAEAGMSDSTVLDASSDVRGDADAVTLSPCSAGRFCYVPLPAQAALKGVAATSIDDAWAISGEALFRWDGASWKEVHTYAGGGPERETFDGLWVTRHDDVWAFGRDSMWRSFFVRYSKTGNEPPSFREVSTDEAMFSLAGSWVTPAPPAFWALPGDGTVVRFREEGGPLVVDHFTPRDGPSDERMYRWSGIWGFGPDDLFVGGTACVRDPSYPFPYCDASVPPRAALGHYDGTDFAITLLGDGQNVGAMFGTPPGQERHLWITLTDASDGPSSLALMKVTGRGVVGGPLYSKVLGKVRERVVGAAASANAAWISNGRLLWRWTGAELEATATARNGVPVGTIAGIWAGSSDEAWIVGRAVPQPDLPPSGFAARRRADGGEP